MSISELDMAWLGGIIDGEGNIYVGEKTSKANQAKYLDVKLRVSSTDMRMIHKISVIYKDLNLCFHFACVNWKRSPWKRAISINTASQGSIKKLLTRVIPYLINKKDTAETLLKIINFVQSYPKGGNTVKRNYWDTPRMKRLLAEYEVHSKWYFDPSTTTRRANSVFEFGDIV